MVDYEQHTSVSNSLCESKGEPEGDTQLYQVKERDTATDNPNCLAIDICLGVQVFQQVAEITGITDITIKICLQSPASPRDVRIIRIAGTHS